MDPDPGHHVVRTGKIPFLQSRASAPVLASTLLSVGVLTALPFLPFGRSFGLAALPAGYFGWLALVTAGYMAAAALVHRRLNLPDRQQRYRRVPVTWANGRSCKHDGRLPGLSCIGLIAQMKGSRM